MSLSIFFSRVSFPTYSHLPFSGVTCSIVDCLRHKAAVQSRSQEPVPHTPGWTSALEDFLVHGIPFVGHSARTKDKGSQSDLGRSYSTGDIKRRPKTGTRGPYEIFVKERLMGIYLAIFVHRDAKHLVRGASFSPTVR